MAPRTLSWCRLLGCPSGTLAFSLEPHRQGVEFFGGSPTMPIQFGDFTSFVDRIKYVNLVGTDLVDQAKK